MVVVQIELRLDLGQLDVRLVVGVDRADVAPVGVLLAVLVEKRKRLHAAIANHRGDDVPAEVVRAIGQRRVFAQLVEQKVGVEHVNAHRRQAVLRIAGNRLRLGRLFLEADDAVALRRPA